MPLLVATLTDEILKLTDKSRGDFKGWPLVLSGFSIDVAATNDLVASNWATAALAYFSGLVVPPVPPPALLAGQAAFHSAMLGLLGPPGSVTAAAALSAGFTAFAAVLAAQAAPPAALPPPAPLVIPIGPPIPDPHPPAANIAAAVHAWCLTGLYGVPPAPPATPWA